MIAKIAIWFLVSKLVLAQLNGEFWWLDNRVSEYHHTIIPLPKFENLSEFDNDESDRIVFRDSNLLENDEKQSKPFDKVDRMKVSKVQIYNHFQDENKIIWPNNDINKYDITTVNNLLKDDIKIEPEKKYPPQRNNEEFTFTFPDSENYISKNKFTNSMDTPILINSTTVRNNNTNSVDSYDDIKMNESQRNTFKLNKVQKPLHDKNVWYSDIKKVKDVFGSNFPKEISEVELTDKPLAHNTNKELPFIFPETQTDKLHFTDISNSNTKATVNEFVKHDLLNDIKNNKNRDDKIEVFTVRNDYQDENKIVWPSDGIEKSKSIIDNFSIDPSTKQWNKNDIMPQRSSVKFTFITPDTEPDKLILDDMPTSSTETVFELVEKATVSNLDSVIFFSDMKTSEQKYNIIAINKSQDNFQDKNNIVWPIHTEKNQIKSNVLKDHSFAPQKKEDIFLLNTTKQDMATSTTKKTISKPDDTTTALETIATEISLINNSFTSIIPKEEDTHTKTICTYMKKHECILRNGFIYSYDFGKSQKQVSSDPQLICCVLPLPIKKEEARKNEQDSIDINEENPQIYFPNTQQPQRRKRSNNEATNTNAALKQRNVLLQHKYGIKSQILSPGLTQTKMDDNSDEDPYWNIKNPRNENKQNTQKKIDYFENYDHDYEDELPKPGLVGLYSDHGSKSPWTFNNQGPYGGSSDYDDVDDTDTPSFGYSTIDPRVGLHSKTRKRGKPLKQITNSEEDTYEPERQIINFQSNPDFHVLEGFKLLNLVRTKNRGHTQNERKTTDILDENGNKESIETSPYEISSEISDEELFEEDQLFISCGRSVKLANNIIRGNQLGDTEIGTHPWLAFVVQTENVQNILCYAALVHPRAALTAAECVYGTSPGEVTVIAGLWDLNKKDRWRSRVASIHFHPKLIHEDLTRGLSILNWKRPLRLDVHVQPACLAEAQSGIDCKFFGWGKFDQEIRPRSRWQRATVKSCSRLLSANKHVDLPSNAFCATVSSRGTVVTDIGGPLVCNVNGRQAVIGVTVFRHNGVFVLLPSRNMALAAEGLIDD